MKTRRNVNFMLSMNLQHSNHRLLSRDYQVLLMFRALSINKKRHFSCLWLIEARPLEYRNSANFADGVSSGASHPIVGVVWLDEPCLEPDSMAPKSRRVAVG